MRDPQPSRRTARTAGQFVRWFRNSKDNNMSTQPQLSPIEQLMRGPQPSVSAQPQGQNDLSPIERLMQQPPAQQSTPSGQVTNDVGQQVVTPQPGESFTDTVNRAKALQKQREAAGTQQQALNAESATIPAKTAQTLGAAATIGGVGPAILAAPGEIAGLAPEAVSAAKALVQAHPVAAKALGKMLVAGAMGGDLGHSAKTAILGALLGGLW
jgi:hypothetical protein